MDSQTKIEKEQNIVDQSKLEVDFLNFVMVRIGRRLPDFSFVSQVYSHQRDSWLAIDIAVKDSLFTIVKKVGTDEFQVNCNKEGVQSKGLGIDCKQLHDHLVREKNWHI